MQPQITIPNPADPIVAWVREKEWHIKSFIGTLVRKESPSDDPSAVNGFVELFADFCAPRAKVRVLPGGKFGKHLVCEFDLPGGNKRGQILTLGHSDTVWPMGTLEHMPFEERDGRLWGPGVLDMKAGIAFFFFATWALRDLDIPVASRVVLQLNSDEEVGSHSSRELTERQARKSKAVLVLEPGTGLTGKLKTARKGVGDYHVTVRGRGAHAGVDFAAGASAIVELARQIQAIAGFTDETCGITVNPGVISGGTRSNVIAAEARAHVDVRVLRLADAAGLDWKFRNLEPFDRRCTIEVTGGLNRPPMEWSLGIANLFQKAKELARGMGVELEESLTGGGSDGNFTAALGVPTLDGLGAVGEGAHAANESILVDRIVDRTALLAKLIAAL